MSLLLLVMLLCSIVNTKSWHEKIYGNVNVFQEHYALPDLPYQYDALEPYIDAKTLRVHHLGHHQAYTDKMNAILKEWRREVSFSLYCISQITWVSTQTHYKWIFDVCEVSPA